MARKNLRRFPFPSDYEEEVIVLLETYGELADPLALADMLGVEPKALRNFLQTARAREAIESAPKNAKALLRPHFAIEDSDTQRPSYGHEVPDGLHEIVEVNQQSCNTALSVLAKIKKKRVANDV